MLSSLATSNFEFAANELLTRFTAFCGSPTADVGRRLNLDIHTFLLAHTHVNPDSAEWRKLLGAGIATALWLDVSVSAADMDSPTYCEHLSTLSF